jgi:hypothetical protein
MAVSAASSASVLPFDHPATYSTDHDVMSRALGPSDVTAEVIGSDVVVWGARSRAWVADQG